MKRRKIEIILNHEFQSGTVAVPLTNTHAALGYLAMWALGSDRYMDCTIVGDKEGNLDAVYKNGHGETTYQIGAILRDDGTYSFHS